MLATMLLVRLTLAAALFALAGCSSEPSIEGAGDVATRFHGIAQSANVLGNANAAVTMSEFADLQCPYCREYDVQALPTIVERYVRPGNVRLEFLNIAFLGPDSERGAQMAAAVGLQRHLWDFVDLFYENQGDENSGYVTDEFLRAVAANVSNVDVDRAMADRSSPEVETALSKANDEATSWGVDGTPTFLIGKTGATPHVFLPDSLDAQPFVDALDAELAQ